MITFIWRHQVRDLVSMKGDQFLEQLVFEGEQEREVGGDIPLTRPYHLTVTNKAPELRRWIDIHPLPQTELQ